MSKIEAMKFANTVRGQYIMGQALYLAIQSIEARPKIEQEPSNVADMKFLMDNLFPMFNSIQAQQAAMASFAKGIIKAKKEKGI